MSDMTDAETIQELNRLFAEEVEAAIRYLHLLSAVRGLERLSVEPVLRSAFEETLGHAQVIGQKIRALGDAPHLRVSLDMPPKPLSGKEALEIALTFEEAALSAYQDALRNVEGNIELEEFMRSQIALESQHVAVLKELLD